MTVVVIEITRNELQLNFGVSDHCLDYGSLLIIRMIVVVSYPLENKHNTCAHNIPTSHVPNNRFRDNLMIIVYIKQIFVAAADNIISYYIIYYYIILYYSILYYIICSYISL